MAQHAPDIFASGGTTYDASLMFAEEGTKVDVKTEELIGQTFFSPTKRKNIR